LQGWTNSSAPWTSRGGHGSFTLGSYLYVAGGIHTLADGARFYLNDVWFITLNGFWHPLGDSSSRKFTPRWVGSLHLDLDLDLD
jgi:hypothetical protein